MDAEAGRSHQVDEKTPLLKSGSKSLESSLRRSNQQRPTTFKAYKQRWYILAIFSVFVCFYQDVIWNTWGPISDSALFAFPSWTAGTVALIGNWGNILFLVAVVPICYITERWGLRAAVLCTVLLVAIGTALRCITIKEPFFTWTCHACGILVGIGSVTMLQAPPILSSLWFPAGERTTATVIAYTFTQLGTAGSFLEPLFVRDNTTNEITSAEVKGDIMRLMYIEAGIAIGALVIFLAYFPASPPSPASTSSTIPRTPLLQGAKDAIRNGRLWWLGLSYGISQGISWAWVAVLNFNLEPLHVTQEQTGLIAIVATLVSCAMSLLLARAFEVLQSYTKHIILGTLFLATGCYVWLLLMARGVISVSYAQVFTSIVLAQTFTFLPNPLMVEVAVELSYPCPEGIVSAFLTVMINIVSSIFLFIFSIPGIGFQWMDWCLVASTSLVIPPLMMTKVTYERSFVDRNQHST